MPQKYNFWITNICVWIAFLISCKIINILFESSFCRWQWQRRWRRWRRRRRWRRWQWQLVGRIERSLQQDGGHLRGHQLAGGQQPERGSSADLLVPLPDAEGSAPRLCTASAIQEVQSGSAAECNPLRGRLLAGGCGQWPTLDLLAPHVSRLIYIAG